MFHDKYESLPFLKTFTLQSLKDTQHTAHHLASCLKPSDILLLSGMLGAGKTTFARFVIETLVKKEVHVSSPTFPLVVGYESLKGPIMHADFYRLSLKESASLGLEEELYRSISLIEWPENMGFEVHNPLILRFSHASVSSNAPKNKTLTARHQETRTLKLYGSDAWKKRLDTLMQEGRQK